MSCVKFARLCPAGVGTFGCLVRFANASQPMTTFRFISQGRLTCPPLLRTRDQFGNNRNTHPNLKLYSKLAEGEDITEAESVSGKLTVRWNWVVRGKYEVAAFDAQDNPAVAVECSESKYLHRHTCSNCKTVYDHSHPYRSLKHPQHIKDCPQCKAFAPLDKEINKLS